MKKLNIFCFGFGQVAKNFIKKLKIEKIPFKLSVTSREESKKKIFEGIDYQSFQFDEKKIDNNLIESFQDADHILISIAPVNGDDIVIKKLEKPKGFIARKLSSSFDNQIDSIANAIEERAMWQKYGL